MKVYIGPYVDWIGPYQIAEKILFWIPKYDGTIATNTAKHMTNMFMVSVNGFQK